MPDFPLTTVMSTALAASQVLKTSAGTLYELTIFNSKGSAQFILVMDAASLPSNGAVTLLYPPIPIAANTLLFLELKNPIKSTRGITVANSSTGTFSITVGSADCVFHAQIQ